MERAIVIGSPGAGKSTFARRLRDATGLPLYYLDAIWHRPDRTTAPREEFDARLRAILATGRWIVDGNYIRTLPMRLEACDTVFLLDYPTEVCLAGAAERIGRPREDLPWVEESFDPEFRRWIETFSAEQLPQIYAMLESGGAGRVVRIFHSREEADAWFRRAGR